MSLWTTLTGWFDKDRKHLIYHVMDQAHVDLKLNPESLEAGCHYIRLRLADMFLRKEVAWGQSWYPAVHSIIRFDFAERSVEIPGIADWSRVGLQNNGNGDVVGHNYMLTQAMPFNGGVVSLGAGLIALEGQNYLKAYLKTLGNLTDLLMVPQLSAAMKIVEPLTLGIQELVGAGNGHIHLGFYNSYSAGELSDGYIAIIRATGEELDTDRLWVVKDQLRVGQSMAESKPLDKFDYMLLRTEVFKTRDDWEKLDSINEPFQESLKALSDPDTAAQAPRHIRQALLRVTQAPELTDAQKRMVFNKLKENYEQAKIDLAYAGATNSSLPTLKELMRHQGKISNALSEGLPTLAEINSVAPVRQSIDPSYATTADESLEAVASAEAVLSEFYFALLGDAVDGERVKCESEVDLVFNYGVASNNALAIIKQAEELDKARQQNGELGLSVIPTGFTFRDEAWFRKIKFVEGNLEAPVSFKLRADAQPVKNSGFYIIFDRNGFVLYEFHLKVELVSALDEPALVSARVPVNLNLDELMAGKDRTQRTAVLAISALGQTLNAYYRNNETQETRVYQFQTIDRDMLAKRIGKTSAKLSPVASDDIWSEPCNPITSPAEGSAQAYEDLLKRVVTEGSILYADLSEDEDLGKLLDKISALQTGSVVQISTNCAFLPWEILYPRSYNMERDDDPPQEQELWGNRFLIESLLIGEIGDITGPFAAHEHSAPFVSLNFNPTIDETGAFEGSAYKPVADQISVAQNSYAGKVSKLEINVGKEAIKKMIAQKNYAATLIYFYCHGQSDGTFIVTQDEKLEVDRNFYIDPAFIDNSINFSNGPIIFLNSCSSGQYSPLSLTNFFSRFKEKQALGLIATSFPVPATFGAAFGEELIKRYLDGMTIGEALWRLRRELLQEKNPVGLFYSLQCPFETRAHHEN
ncbi:MAG: CHAT domain-containing protein [Acidobacteria bacterium]|nr:CHAT domain-containing protein [Acidobacteriota bacterium]